MARTVGQKLIALRGKKTQETVAKAVDISVSALCMYEQNLRTPRDEVKLRLAEYFGVSVGELFFNQRVHKK